jgi:hypothetical protein
MAMRHKTANINGTNHHVPDNNDIVSCIRCRANSQISNNGV